MICSLIGHNDVCVNKTHFEVSVIEHFSWGPYTGANKKEEIERRYFECSRCKRKRTELR